VDVAGSAAVAPGEAVGVEVPCPAGELDLVIWRSFDGGLRVMEARCPHQWSHLAAEGVVDGDEIVCTAHFWRFDADGRGTKLNIKGRRDPKADITVYPCREREGRIEVSITD
jgi:phenylpropionate dioxygenase-like ring-hydroxylating dioxygenase large terminal subunit